MSCTEHWAELRSSVGDEVLIVIDASESAEDYRQDILELACGLVEILPSEVSKRVAFLGSPRRYSADELLDAGDELWSAHLGRCSVLHPVFPGGIGESGGWIVVVGTGSIFDLSDWGESLRDRLVLVSVGEPLADSERFGTVLSTRRAEDVCRTVHNPIERSSIASPGWLPFWWNNPAYELEFQQGNAALFLEGNVRSELVVGYLGPAGLVPTVDRTFAGGRQESLRLTTHPPVSRELSCLRLMTAGEAAGFYREPTDRGTWWTSEGRERIRATVPRDSGLVLLAESPEGLRVYAYPWNVIPLGESRAGVCGPEGIITLERDPLSGLWVESAGGLCESCKSIRGGIYVAAL